METLLTSRTYPFIDIAVLDGVRQRFGTSDTLIVLSGNSDRIVWANGPGAHFLGYDGIEEVVGEELPTAVQRQIRSLTGFPEIGANRSVTIRLLRGMQSNAVRFSASQLQLPDGEPAVLLAVSAVAQGRTETEIARHAISGFDGPDHFAAMVRGDGVVLASSRGFAELGFDSALLRQMTGEVATEEDRLVKRPFTVGGISYPVGIARLGDQPLLCLLVAVDGTAVEAVSQRASALRDLTNNNASPVAGEVLPLSSETTPLGEPERQSRTQIDRWYFNEQSENGTDAETEASPTVARSAETEPASGELESTETVRNDGLQPPDEGRDPEKMTVGVTDSATLKHRQPDLDAGPIRFVWKTDASGNFSDLSENFAKAVNIDVSDLIGRSFSEVARRLEFDADGEIAGLLARRDTWSGRSISWPVAGTDLRVPVDLAALPAYDREREFQGFRGFGVARMADADVAESDAALATVERPFSKILPEETETISANTTKAGSVENEATSDKPVTGESYRQSGSAMDKRPVAPATDIPDETDPQSHESRETVASAGDGFRGEIPVLDVQPSESRRNSDKVVRLAEHRQDRSEVRPPAEKALTPSEQMAFRQIADRLKEDSEAAILAREVTVKPIAPTPPDTPNVPRKAFMPSAFWEPKTRRADVTHEVLDRLPVPLLVVTGDTIHHANPEFLTLSGHDSLESLGASGGLETLFDDALTVEGGVTDTTRRALRMRSSDGALIPVDVGVQSIPWNGTKALVMAIRPTRQEAELSEQAGRLEARIAELGSILDTATDGVVLIGTDSRIRSINRSAEALFGYENNELDGKPFTTLFAVESHRAAQDYLAGLSNNGVASVLNDGREVIGREARGRFIPLFMTIGILQGERGYCAVLRDITQWKRAEEDLTRARRDAEHASTQKTGFLARVSHEIRTPLNAIIGFSDLMMDGRFGLIGNERYRGYLRDINESGKHVLDLVNDLLDISKIEAGEQELNNEPVALNDVLSQSVATLQPQANSNRVIIRTSLASTLPAIVGDLRSFRQIALNLLSNAVRYTPPGGQVIVSSSAEPNGDVVMRIRDTGTGMTRDEIDQALKPFKQINAINRARGDGTGLGLPLTKAMVEANRARFSITSTPGEGTMAEITIPSTRVLAE